MTDSSQPVGATTYKQTSFGILPHKELLKYEIEGVKRGLEHIHHVINQPSFQITPDFILELHKVSFAWIFPEWAGKFRTIQVKYSDKEAPQSFLIPELITNLCDDLIEQIKSLPNHNDISYIHRVISMLAWFQHRFVVIHPFQDYNGRTARMLTLAITTNLDLPPIELSVDNPKTREKYLQAMKQADNSDYTQLETLLGQAMTESLSEAIK